MEWAFAAVMIAVVLGGAILPTAKAWFAHRERMAKIEKGIDPDQPPINR